MRAAAFVGPKIRHLGSHDRKSDALLRGEIAQALHLGLADRHALGLPGDARVAGSAVDLFDLRRARQRIDNGVFAAAGTYYQNFHTVKIERLKVKS